MGIRSITPPTTQAELEISIVAAQPTGGANLVYVFLVLSVHILDSEGKGIALDRAVPGEKWRQGINPERTSKEFDARSPLPWTHTQAELAVEVSVCYSEYGKRSQNITRV